MTLSIIPVDQAGIDNIADGLSGFTDESSELQQSMMTTLFIAGASDASKSTVCLSPLGRWLSHVGSQLTALLDC